MSCQTLSKSLQESIIALKLNIALNDAYEKGGQHSVIRFALQFWIGKDIENHDRALDNGAVQMLLPPPP